MKKVYFQPSLYKGHSFCVTFATQTLAYAKQFTISFSETVYNNNNNYYNYVDKANRYISTRLCIMHFTYLGFSGKEQADDIFKEALQMRDMDHRNVMSLVGVCFNKSDPCIVMPYMENGSLLVNLRKKRQKLVVLDRGSQEVSFWKFSTIVVVE